MEIGALARVLLLGGILSLTVSSGSASWFHTSDSYTPRIGLVLHVACQHYPQTECERRSGLPREFKERPAMLGGITATASVISIVLTLIVLGTHLQARREQSAESLSQVVGRTPAIVSALAALVLGIVTAAVLTSSPAITSLGYVFPLFILGCASSAAGSWLAGAGAAEWSRKHDSGGSSPGL